VIAVEAAHTAIYPDLGEPWRVSKLYYNAFPRSAMVRATEMAKNAGMDPPFGDANPDELPFLTPDEWVTTTVHHPDQMGRKLAAMRAHRSQLTEEEFPLLRLPEEVAREVWADEFFQLVICRVPTALPETDVFAGLEEGAVVGA
jgi:LmbE family N-acetylglucosaminyl deacetylase